MLKAEIRQQLVDHYLDFYTLAFSILANADDARDAVQEALTRTMAKSRVDDPINYCYQSVRHAAIDTMRYRKRFVKLEPAMLDQEALSVVNENYSILLEEAQTLRDGLPKAQRALVELHDEEGLSYAELSKLTGISRMTIRRMLEKAHTKMRKEMNNKKDTII